MRHFRKTALSIAAAQVAVLWSGMALAQTAPAPAAAASAASGDAGAVVVIRGQRAALMSAQKIKREAEEIVDSIVADEIGKLPDRSVTEVLQRIVGVAIDRTMSRGDPEHFSVEGAGVTIRGLTYVRSELNGRDSFSANGGRSLNFEDVPPELMAGVDVYKNPSAEQIEGAVSGLVNLRTALPFDFSGAKGSFSLQTTSSSLRKKNSPSFSGLLANSWDTDLGKFGAMIDLAHSDSATRTDAFQVEPYYPRTDVVPGKTVWIPKGSQWRTLEFDRSRDGIYGAVQWKKGDVESSLTYFKSKYKFDWAESAIFSQVGSAYNITVDPGATYDANGVFRSGVLRDAADGGINFGDDTRTATRKSDTQDLSWSLKWKASDRWSFKSDLQIVRAKTQGFDSTVATGVTMPSENIDLTGSVPRLSFTDAERAYLANPNNYYWAFTMEHLDKSVAKEKAWKGDARFKFDDPVLQDIRFGVRLNERQATTTNSNPSYNWAAITQPWQIGWDIGKLASLGDPRFSGNTHLGSFNNFFNGKATAPPSLVFPDVSLANGFPDSYTALHKYHDILCAEQTAAQGWGSGCPAWAAASFGSDPAGINDQRERTQAAYTQLRFGFENWRFPVEGNVGLRLVRTEDTAHGYTTFTPKLAAPPVGGNVTGLVIPVIAAFAQAEDFRNTYTNVLPSLNLKMKVDDKLQFRAALASAISRPDFSQLQAFTTLAQDFKSTTTGSTLNVDSFTQTGTGTGNPMLRPTKSNQLDLTAEWYPERATSLTMAVFYKQLKDIVINQSYIRQIPDSSGKAQDFVVTGPANGAKGKAQGVELAFQTYFDKLPGWLSGFGVQTNYTFVDSKQTLYAPIYSPYCSGQSSAGNLNLNINGCDTNGRTFGNQPLQNLSRNAYNLTLMYDKGPISARVAYSWRGKYLQAINVNGTQGGDAMDSNPNSPTFGTHPSGSAAIAWALPTWADGYGQLDAGISYKLTDDLSIGLEGQNLGNAIYKQFMVQSTGNNGRAWFATGPRYTAQVRYSF